jgi:hypothetical protein
MGSRERLPRRTAIADWFGGLPDRIFVYRRKRRARRTAHRMKLDYATSVLLTLCHKVEIESDLYMKDGRDLRNLLPVFRSVREQVEELRKGIGC